MTNSNSQPGQRQDARTPREQTRVGMSFICTDAVAPKPRIAINDGGRMRAGFKDEPPGGCVVRSIAIATGKPYRQVHDELAAACQFYRSRPKERWRPCPDRGMEPSVYGPYLSALGWEWIEVEKRLRWFELRHPGRIIVSLHGHLLAMIDGVVHDTFFSWRGRSLVRGLHRPKEARIIENLKKPSEWRRS